MKYNNNSCKGRTKEEQNAVPWSYSLIFQTSKKASHFREHSLGSENFLSSYMPSPCCCKDTAVLLWWRSTPWKAFCRKSRNNFTNLTWCLSDGLCIVNKINLTCWFLLKLRFLLSAKKWIWTSLVSWIPDLWCEAEIYDDPVQLNQLNLSVRGLCYPLRTTWKQRRACFAGLHAHFLNIW